MKKKKPSKKPAPSIIQLGVNYLWMVLLYIINARKRGTRKSQGRSQELNYRTPRDYGKEGHPTVKPMPHAGVSTHVVDDERRAMKEFLQISIRLKKEGHIPKGFNVTKIDFFPIRECYGFTMSNLQTDYVDKEEVEDGGTKKNST